MQQMLAYADYDQYEMVRAGTCALGQRKFDNFALYDRVRCLSLAPDKRNFLIVGDSHAADLWYGFSKRFPRIVCRAFLLHRPLPEKVGRILVVKYVMALGKSLGRIG